MFAQLGSLVFETSFPLTGLESRRGYSYARHATIEGKPRLQAVGDELEEVELDLTFDVAFCDPLSSLEQLHAIGEAHEAVPLLLGTGKVLGRYVVQQVDVTYQETDRRGQLTRATCRVQLAEWAEDPASVPPRRGPALAAAPAPATAKRAQAAPPPAGDPHAVPTSQITRQGA